MAALPVVLCRWWSAMATPTSWTPLRMPVRAVMCLGDELWQQVQ